MWAPTHHTARTHFVHGRAVATRPCYTLPLTRACMLLYTLCQSLNGPVSPCSEIRFTIDFGRDEFCSGSSLGYFDSLSVPVSCLHIQENVDGFFLT